MAGKLSDQIFNSTIPQAYDRVNSDDAVAAMRGGIQANKHFKTRANGPQQHAMNAGVEAVFLEETLYGTHYIFHKHGIIVVG
jgi:hypothetical protein